jgi:hypothetical protein
MKAQVKHRTNQSQFSGAGRTGLEIKRRHDLSIRQECEDIAESRKLATYIKPPASNAELNRQFMSPAALALKRKTPMFTIYE